MYAAPASTCPAESTDGHHQPVNAVYLKALCNVQLVYRHAQKLAGVSCYADFDALPHTLRQFYIKTALEQLASMSRFRTQIPDWQSQDFPCHSLPYLPLQSGQGHHHHDASAFGGGGPHHQTLPLHHHLHGGNLAATPPMPLPMADPPFPAAPPPTPVSIYTPGPHGGGDIDEYTWGTTSSSSYSTSGGSFHSAAGGPDIRDGGFKPDPSSSPFRLSYDSMETDHANTVSPQDLHPEVDYTHFHGMSMFPMTAEELGSMPMFPFLSSEAEVLGHPVPAAAAAGPEYGTTAAASVRRPLPSAAPGPSTHRKTSSAASSRGSVGTAASHAGSTTSSHSSKRRAHAPGPRGSGSASGRSCAPTAPDTIPEGTFVPGRHNVPAEPPPPMQFQGRVSGFPPPPPSSIIPSNDYSRPPVENTRAKSSSHRSSRKKSSSQQAGEHKSSSTNKSSPPLRKKKSSGSGSGKTTPSSSQQQVIVPSQPLFPIGQNKPGFVPIGCLGVASAAQGNISPLDLGLKKRIIVAERDAGLTYKAIKNKYTRWREAESTYRGLDRTARLPLEHRERVASWSEQHIQSLRRGMAILRDPMRPTLKGFPWKQLADYIKAETGKPFGATTAKKKWFEIAAEGDEEIDDDEDGDEDDEMTGWERLD